MKNLILILGILLSGISFGQVTIEIFSANGEYETLVNDSASVSLTLIDSSKLVIQDKNLTAYYKVGEVEVFKTGCKDDDVRVIRIEILEDKHNLVGITVWEGMNLVIFRYRDHTTVVNSGPGITYN